MRFLFSVQVIEKAQKKAQFSFCGQRKAFHYILFFEEFTLFSSLRSAWPVLKCNQGSDVLENLEVHILLYGQGNYVSKRKFMYL